MQDWLVNKISGRYPQGRVKRWIGKVSGDGGERLSHRFAEAYFRRFMRDTLGTFADSPDRGPFPPDELLMRTFVLNEKDAQKKLKPDFYFSSGYWHLLWWLQTAARNGFNLRTAGAIMDFGSGTARMIRHLRCINGIRLVGTDLFAPNVEWCRKNISGVEFHHNTGEPPLSFAEGGAFDLIYAASVFTHIPLETQGLWIAELSRVLKPGGFLVCDVLGRFHQEAILTSEDMERMKRTGSVTVTQHDERASLATKLIGSWDVFQTRHEVLKSFSRHFIVCDYIPAKLDTLVLRKPGRPD